MRRRDFLAGLAVGGGSIAGCVRSPGEHPDDEAGTESATPTEIPLVKLGTPAILCEEDIIEDFGIRALVDPAVAPDWSNVEIDPKYRREGASGLTDEQVVIGLARGDRARAYPLSVVWWHEIVNDSLDVPVMVTYCPLCDTGMVAERVVDGEPTRFDVSGLLWRPPQLKSMISESNGTVFGIAPGNPDAPIRNNGNLVMYDLATRSYWSQILATALCGPQTGEFLPLILSTTTTWGEWRTAHPETEVILPPPHTDVL